MQRAKHRPVPRIDDSPTRNAKNIGSYSTTATHGKMDHKGQEGSRGQILPKIQTEFYFKIIHPR
jgi:hypothetical protein